ncbi:hypothetical protein EP331_04810 [bacterium]|nr:MAG: hypothetical protein EP331_04810 [bacterium]
MPYEPLKYIHIASYIIWLLSFFGSVYFFFKIRSATSDGKPQLMRKERLISSMGGHLGFLGIFLSGGAMVSIKSGPKWGWFNFTDFAWLAWKQVFFFVALVIIGALVMPGSAKIKRLVANNGSLDEIEQLWTKTFFFSLLVYVIVFINTLLGLEKPF